MVRSLTQDEALARAAMLEIERYDIEVDLTDLPHGPAVRCVSTITVSCRRPGDTFVDCAADVVAATLDGQPLAAAEDGRIALPGLSGRHVVRVVSEQTDTRDSDRVHKAVDPADGQVYLWMCLAPDQGRYVWACFDQPDLKAPHALQVTAPDQWRVLSNSGSPLVEELTGAVRRWTFPDTPPLSTYNMVVNAGPFHEIRRELGGYDLGIHARQSLATALERDADEIFTLTDQGLRFFGEVFAMPFPQRKYDQVFAPDFGGAMENYGCVTWSDAFLRRSEPTPAERDVLARYLLHELAHMWFGNIVTMRWWDDLWLNEAFAEFASNWAAVRATSYSDAWAGHLAGEKLRAYLADQGPTTHPIRQQIRDVDEASATFDAITYPKGASVLHQLMVYVGEERFATGMARYFADHAWGNTTLQDLTDALAAASGRDLDHWRRAWLEQAGPDRLGLRQADSGDLQLTASGPGPGGTEPRPQVLAVGAYRDDGDRLTLIGRELVEVAGPTTPVALDGSADLYLLNDDDLTYATARPDAGRRDAFFVAAGRLPTPLARGVAVATAYDMLTQGEASAVELVQCLTGVLERETSASVVEPYLSLVAETAEFWSPEQDRIGLCRDVADMCWRLAETPARRRVALRALARVAPDLDVVDRLDAEANDDVDLRWRTLVKRAELGGATTDLTDRLSRIDRDPDSWIRALCVRAAAPDPDTKADAWQQIAVDRVVPVGYFGIVTTAFWRPGQDAVLGPYAQHYLDLLPGLDRGGMLLATAYSARLFPVVGIDAAYVGRAEEQADGAGPVISKEVRARADLVRRMLRSRGVGQTA